MFYSEQVRKACNIMFEAHKNDVDKGGYPYVFHPFYLASQMEDEDTACVALLHDVVEDHGDEYSFERLEREGFNSRVMEALRLMTHGKDVPYMEYVTRIAGNPITAKVKIADLEHNLDTRRVNGVRPPKYETYLRALALLKGEESAGTASRKGLEEK